MPQLLTLSRAARLVGVSRAALQRKIKNNELQTFEGAIKVSDLLRAYPETSLEDDSALERVKQIKAKAAPRIRGRSELPPPDVLASRLTYLSYELVETRNKAANYAQLLAQLTEKIEQLCQEQEQPSLCALRTWLQTELDKHVTVPKRKNELLVKDTFLRMLAAQVKVIPSGHEFFLEGTDSLLDAALSAGLNLQYGCNNGSCGTCKARVVSGEVMKIRDYEYCLTETEKNLGYVLMCSHTAVTDVIIEAEEAQSVADLPQQRITTSLKKRLYPSENLMILHVLTPKTKILRFMAGQHVTITLRDGISAEHHIASCPCDGQHLQFHIRRRIDTPFNQLLFDVTDFPHSLQITGPHGDFVLHKDQARPVLFFAAEEGFGPIKSLIEHAISIDSTDAYYLCWLVECEGQHYMDNLCRAWRDALDNFYYTPLVANSEQQTDKIKQFMQNLCAEYESLSTFHIYIAGDNDFITTVNNVLLQNDIETTQIFSEVIG